MVSFAPWTAAVKNAACSAHKYTRFAQSFAAQLTEVPPEQYEQSVRQKMAYWLFVFCLHPALRMLHDLLSDCRDGDELVQYDS